MKVSEAKEKVCPFILNNGQFAYEKVTDRYNIPANINCICGDCMAWEWTFSHTDTVTVQWKASDGTMYTQHSKELKDDEKEGYCKRLTE